MLINEGRLNTESDVEQKVIIPLLTDAQFLSIPVDSIHTKEYLAPAALDKAAGKLSGYYPDYSVFLHGVPVLIVEAKAPDVPPEEGYREASLYARHLNQRFPTTINPCSRIIATNGRVLLFGFWDAAPELNLPLTQL